MELHKLIYFYVIKKLKKRESLRNHPRNNKNNNSSLTITLNPLPNFFNILQKILFRNNPPTTFILHQLSLIFLPPRMFQLHLSIIILIFFPNHRLRTSSPWRWQMLQMFLYCCLLEK